MTHGDTDPSTRDANGSLKIPRPAVAHTLREPLVIPMP